MTQTSKISSELVKHLDKYTETMAGLKMEPVNLVFIGAESSIRSAFKQAGWFEAERLGPLSLVKSLYAIFFKRPYPTGPFTPLTMGHHVQDLAFQKPTKSNNFRQRHHLRIWRTGRKLADGRPVWVGSASLDDNIKVRFGLQFISHSIDPDLNRESQFVASELDAQIKTIQVTQPDRTTTGFGDAYFTDGRANVIEL